MQVLHCGKIKFQYQKFCSCICLIILNKYKVTVCERRREDLRFRKKTKTEEFQNKIKGFFVANKTHSTPPNQNSCLKNITGPELAATSNDVWVCLGRCLGEEGRDASVRYTKYNGPLHCSG